MRNLAVSKEPLAAPLARAHVDLSFSNDQSDIDRLIAALPYV